MNTWMAFSCGVIVGFFLLAWIVGGLHIAFDYLDARRQKGAR